MNRNKQRSNDKKFGIAIGPIGSDPDDIIQTILEISRTKNEGHEIIISDQKVSIDGLFVSFNVSSYKEKQVITELNGINNLFITPVDVNSCESTCEIIHQNFSTMIYDSETLNLSNLPELGITCNLCIPHNTSFVLFYSALLCKQERIQIKKLVYKENNIRDLKGFLPTSVFFPYLKEIIIPTNIQINDIFREQFQITQDDSSDYCITQENYWDKIGFPIISPPKTFLTDPELTERCSHYELQMYQPVKLNPSFKGNSLIIQFFECAWHDIESLAQFYVSDSIFSITVNYHSPNSPLCYYDKFSRNLLFTNNTNNYISGCDDIILAQKELFGDHFYAYVTAVNELIVQPQYICIVTHGVFQLNEDVMGFDRTMNVVFDDDQAAIINDHIFIRNPEKIE